MLTRNDFQKMKQNGEKITMVTAYDYPSAKMVEEAEAAMILVGDSLGMVVLGYSTTIQVTIADMIHHGKAVKRGAPNTFTVVDMPFMSYHVSVEETLVNAQKIFQETNAQALKVEGASETVLKVIQRLTEAGIPVVAHLGLTPQTVNVDGGYHVQGKDESSATRLLEEAELITKHGAIAVVLECVPKELAQLITGKISIPTIGIGAGIHCDGQVLVYHDLLNYGVERVAKFVKQYANFNDIGYEAIQNYVKEVKAEQFPLDNHSFLIKNKNILPK